MPVRIEDLSPKARRQVIERVEAGRVRSTARLRAPVSTWRCHGCGVRFRHWAKAERHGNQPGHHRIEVML